jgi:arylsulfatase A-like enzyme
MLKVKLSVGHDGTIVNGISRIGFMSGGKAARWNDETLADTLTKKAVAFIERSKDRPFFLYLATHDIHVPRCPGDRFKGKTELGVRGDVIEQVDWSVGEIIATLDRLKLSQNTLVVFTSDNGPIVDDGYADGAVQNLDGHKPAGPFRGGKYTVWEGGTRMPFIVRWPGRVKPGTSDALVSQVDFCATFARLAGVKPSASVSPDSENVLPALLGDSPTGRAVLVEQGMPLALRQGSWKFIARPGKGNRGKQAREPGDEKIAPIPVAPKAELYNLANDIAETHNIAPTNPQKVQEMSRLLEKIRQQKDR